MNKKRSNIVFTAAAVVIAACAKPDSAVAPDKGRSAETELRSGVEAPKMQITLPEQSEALAALSAEREKASLDFNKASRTLVAEMFADVKLNPREYNPNPNDHSRAAACVASKHAMQKYGPRLAQLAAEAGLPFTSEFYAQLADDTPACRNNGEMSVFGLSSNLLRVPHAAAAFEITEAELDTFVDGVLADSLTDAPFTAIESIDLSGVPFGDVETLDATLNAVQLPDGSSLDRKILKDAKMELRFQYLENYSYDWPGGEVPYMIFDPYFGWRWPTRGELWGFVGSGCAQGVVTGRTAIAAAARTGARVGAVVGGLEAGTLTIPGAIAGALIGVAGAAGAACAAGGVGGTIALIGYLATS